LRLFEEADAPEVYGVVAANRDDLSEWLPWPPAQTLERTLAFIRLSRRQLADNQGFQAAITDQVRIVGTIGYHRVDWQNRSTSIGYWIAPQSRGRGIVTLAVRALTDHAFEAWKLNRVEIRAAVGNTRSRAIPKRLGFSEEGILRQAELIGERYVDHAVYAMLASDWREDS
jgi:ribosomal-protein-serine acetyltransferase